MAVKTVRPGGGGERKKGLPTDCQHFAVLFWFARHILLHQIKKWETQFIGLWFRLVCNKCWIVGFHEFKE